MSVNEACLNNIARLTEGEITRVGREPHVYSESLAAWVHGIGRTSGTDTDNARMILAKTRADIADLYVASLFDEDGKTVQCLAADREAYYAAIDAHPYYDRRRKAIIARIRMSDLAKMPGFIDITLEAQEAEKAVVSAAAFEQGQQAWQVHRGFTCPNPYSPASPSHDLWEQGWAAEEEIAQK